MSVQDRQQYFKPPFRSGRQYIVAEFLFKGLSRDGIKSRLPQALQKAGTGPTRNADSLINATLDGLKLHGYQYSRKSDGSYKIWRSIDR